MSIRQKPVTDGGRIYVPTLEEAQEYGAGVAGDRDNQWYGTERNRER